MGLWALPRRFFRFFMIPSLWCCVWFRLLLVRLSVFAWLLRPCRLSVRLCLLVFLCLAVFRRFCSVWAAGCVAARLVADVQVFGGPFCVSFFLCPVFVDLGGWSHFRVPHNSFHVMSCFCSTCKLSPCFRGLGVCVCVCVCGPSQKT